jgi:ubiquinone/menaquinone biosynthesis C-methylase UbiE
MDYDSTSIAGAYDRARTLAPESLTAWLGRLEAALNGPPADIVDLGCGTGRFSAALAERFAARVLGVDPSETMLAEARAKSGSAQVRYLPGSAEAIPAFDGSADLVFLSMVFHHIEDRGAAARECARVLRSGGSVAIRNSTRDNTCFPFEGLFDGIEAIIQANIPSVAELKAPFEAEGFELNAHEVVSQALAPNWPAYVEKIALRADSLLARLTDEAFEAGLAAARRHKAPAGPVRSSVDFLVLRRG